MLPRQYRLTRSRDFARARRSGRSAGTPLMSLYVMRSRSPQLRIGFSASKRVGKAVARNRVKRLMREAVRRELPSIYPGQDLVFIARPQAAAASYGQIVDCVCYLLRKTTAVAPAARTASDA